jgi:hypothetical protein
MREIDERERGKGEEGMEQVAKIPKGGKKKRITNAIHAGSISCFVLLKSNKKQKEIKK